MLRIGLVSGLWCVGCNDGGQAGSGSTETASSTSTASGTADPATSLASDATSGDQPPTTTATSTGPVDPTASTAPTSTEAGPTCTNGQLDGEETDIDCGGTCPGCADGATCAGDDDCAAMNCVDGVCVAPTCADDDDCAALDGPCAAGVCDRGTCGVEATAEGTPCDDLQICTAGPAACSGGECVDLDGPVMVDLADVGAGIGGFAIDASKVMDNIGNDQMALIPDFNGDGFADIVIVTSMVQNVMLGRVWVIFGKPDLTHVSLPDIAKGEGGFVLDGVQPGALTGNAVAGADVNADGFGDILISASNYDSGVGTDAGRVYVVLGRPDPVGITLSAIADSFGGFIIDGEMAENSAGSEVAGAGDVNADGITDILVTAPRASFNGVTSGRSYVVFGKADLNPVKLTQVSAGQGGFAIDGVMPSDYSGIRARGAGDLNDDGFADVVLASGNSEIENRLHVVFGKADTAKVQLSAVEAGIGGFLIRKEPDAGNNFPAARAAGDVNGDGVDDLVIGDAAVSLPREHNNGRGYVVFGKQDTATVELADIVAGIGGFATTPFDSFSKGGNEVAPLGDLDGDGLADVLIGVPHDPSEVGSAYVVFGKPDTELVTVEALLAGHGGFSLLGESGAAGFTVDGGHDVNGDGRSDLLIGAVYYSEVFSGGGRVYLVHGGDCHP